MRDNSLPPPLIKDLDSDDDSSDNDSQTMDGNNSDNDSDSDNDNAEHIELADHYHHHHYHERKLLLRRLNLISILDRHEQFPLPIRNKIDELVESLGNAVRDLLLCNDDAPLDDDCSSYSNPDSSWKALLSAASDEDTHLDGVYYHLRREPNVLQKLLSM